MNSFILKFTQDNLFSLYFYLFNDISYDFFLSVLINILFIFYFLLVLYFLNFLIYFRHNFFSNPQLFRFFKFLFDRRFFNTGSNYMQDEILFYFYNLLTLVELVLKSSFIFSLTFLIIKFPFVEVGTSPLLSWKFADFFSKSRFYAYQPGFFSSRTSRDVFNSSSIETVEFDQKISYIKAFKYYYNPKSRYRKRRRRKARSVSIQSLESFNITRMIYQFAKARQIENSKNRVFNRRWLNFIKSRYPSIYKYFVDGFYTTITQSDDPLLRVEPPYKESFSNRGTARSKSLSLNEDPFNLFSYYRPDGSHKETPKNILLSKLFFPGDRSKFVLYRHKWFSEEISMDSTITPQFKDFFYDYEWEPKELLEHELEDDEFIPTIDEETAINNFINFAELFPYSMDPAPETFRATDGLAPYLNSVIANDIYLNLHNRMSIEHPDLAHPFDYVKLANLWKRVHRRGVRRARSEFIGRKGYRSRASFRQLWYRKLDRYFRFTSGTRLAPRFEDLHLLEDPYRKPRLWPADYYEDPAIQGYSFSGEEWDVEDGLHSEKRWGFFYDTRGYSEIAPRGLADLFSKRFIKFFRSSSSFGYRKIESSRSLPTYNSKFSNAARLVRRNSYDRFAYNLYRMREPIIPSLRIQIDQGIGQDATNNTYREFLNQVDSTDSPFLGPVHSVKSVLNESFTVSKAHRQRMYINNDLIRYIINNRTTIRPSESSYLDPIIDSQSIYKESVSDVEDTIPLDFLKINFFGFFIRPIKRFVQFILDQSFFLTTRILAYYDALYILPRFVYPNGEGSTKKQIYGSYHLFKLRLLYFFRRLFRLMVKPAPDTPKVLGFTDYISLYKAARRNEIDNFNFFAISSSLGSSICRAGVVLILFFFNTIKDSALVLSESFITHPAIFISILGLIFISFWRVVYPFEIIYKFITERIPLYRPLQFVIDLVKRIFNFFLNIYDNLHNFEDIFLKGSFGRFLNESIFDYQTRLNKTLNIIFTAVGRLERPVHKLLLKLGIKDSYDRTLILSYSQLPPEADFNVISKLYRKVPFPLKLRTYFFKTTFLSSLFRKIRSILGTLNLRFSKFKLKFLKLYNNYKGRVALKFSKTSYRFKNWFNR